MLGLSFCATKRSGAMAGWRPEEQESGWAGSRVESWIESRTASVFVMRMQPGEERAVMEVMVSNEHFSAQPLSGLQNSDADGVEGGSQECAGSLTCRGGHDRELSRLLKRATQPDGTGSRPGQASGTASHCSP